MQATNTKIEESSADSIEHVHDVLSRLFDGRLRVIAKQSVTYWFNHDRLDRLLAQYVNSLEGCELLYALDRGGKQVSSNIFPASIDASAYAQDLSGRPYAISLFVLRNVTRHGAFACNAYLSQATQRPCVTVMYGVTSGPSLMGFIAADFYPSVATPLPNLVAGGAPQ